MALLSLIFRRLSIPIAKQKTVGPTTKLEYLGIILDTVLMQASLPHDKLSRLTEIVTVFLQKRKCTKCELLSLLGHMQYASRVIIPGRSFVSRLLEAARGARRLHHHVTLSKDCKEDLRVWHIFLKHWNGVSLFLDISCTKSADLTLFTDASGSQGFGAYYHVQWFQGHWPSDIEVHIPDHELSMAYKELVPIVAAAEIWGSQWPRKRIQFMCDNQATCAILNKGRSRSHVIMQLMRHLTLKAARSNFAFTAEYIASKDNALADSLSRFQMTRFRQLAPLADPLPLAIPHSIIFPWKQPLPTSCNTP